MAAPAAIGDTRYKVSSLGSIPGFNYSSPPYFFNTWLYLNNSGTIAGGMIAIDRFNPENWNDMRPFIADAASGIVDFLPPGVVTGSVAGLNDSGQIIGLESLFFAAPWSGVLYRRDSSGLLEYPVFPPGGNSLIDITNGGEVVSGYLINESGHRMKPGPVSMENGYQTTRWSLGMYSGENCYPDPLACSQASFMGSDEIWVTVGTLGGDWSVAYDFNDSGQVVGLSPISGDGSTSTIRAFLWQDGVMTDLIATASNIVDVDPTILSNDTRAIGINNNGQILIQSFQKYGFGYKTHYIWENGQLTLVQNSYGSGSWGYGQRLLAINDNGQIAGWSTPISSSEEELVLLTPYIVGTESDIAINAQSISSTIDAGMTETLSLDIRNLGPANTVVTLDVDLPMGLSLSGDTLGSCTQTAQRVQCNVGDLPATQGVFVDLTVVASQDIEGNVTSRIYGANVDPDEQNNTKTSSIVMSSSGIGGFRIRRPAGKDVYVFRPEQGLRVALDTNGTAIGPGTASIRLELDGEDVGVFDQLNSLTLSDVLPGSHVLRASVVDPDGIATGDSDEVSFIAAKMKTFSYDTNAFQNPDFQSRIQALSGDFFVVPDTIAGTLPDQLQIKTHYFVDGNWQSGRSFQYSELIDPGSAELPYPGYYNYFALGAFGGNFIASSPYQTSAGYVSIHPVIAGADTYMLGIKSNNIFSNNMKHDRFFASIPANMASYGPLETITWSQAQLYPVCYKTTPPYEGCWTAVYDLIRGSNINNIQISDAAGYDSAIWRDQLLLGAYKNDAMGGSSGAVLLTAGVSVIQTIVPSDAKAHDWFGRSLDLHSDRLAVSAMYHDAYAEDGGAVYIYRHDAVSESWNLEQKLGSSTITPGNQFGAQVSLSSHYLATAGMRRGSYDWTEGNQNPIILFQKSGEAWVELGKLIDNYGSVIHAASISLSDGRLAFTTQNYTGVIELDQSVIQADFVIDHVASSYDVAIGDSASAQIVVANQGTDTATVSLEIRGDNWSHSYPTLLPNCYNNDATPGVLFCPLGDFEPNETRVYHYEVFAVDSVSPVHTFTLKTNVQDNDLSNNTVDANYRFYAKVDSDGDGVYDAVDNCTEVANANQRESDGDIYGDACDKDIDNSGLVDIKDFIEEKKLLGSTGPLGDFDESGLVDIADLITVKKALGSVPGPSGYAP